MIAFPNMLVSPAESAGMKVPPDPDNYDSEYNRENFPHFMVYCRVQLGASMPSPTSHFHNAALIAGIPDNQIKEITYSELKDMGLEIGYTWS